MNHLLGAYVAVMKGTSLAEDSAFYLRGGRAVYYADAVGNEDDHVFRGDRALSHVQVRLVRIREGAVCRRREVAYARDQGTAGLCYDYVYPQWAKALYRVRPYSSALRQLKREYSQFNQRIFYRVWEECNEGEIRSFFFQGAYCRGFVRFFKIEVWESYRITCDAESGVLVVFGPWVFGGRGVSSLYLGDRVAVAVAGNP